MIFKEIKNVLVSLVALTIVTGIAYPLFVTGIAQLLFPHQANGSLLENGKGSELIGQTFDQPYYFWGRLSACSYNAAASSGTNYAMTNPALLDAAKARIDALRTADPGNSMPIPVDLVTASGSGLDPHISLDAANYQAARVARARNTSVELIMQSVEQATVYSGILGEKCVNVVRLNSILDSKHKPQSNTTQSHTIEPGLTRSLGFLPH